MEASGPMLAVKPTSAVPRQRRRHPLAFVGAAVIGTALAGFACGGQSNESVVSPQGAQSATAPVISADTVDSAETGAVTTVPVADVGPTELSKQTTIGDQPLTLRGMGGLATGMTLPDVEELLGLTIAPYANAGVPCQYAYVAGDDNSPRLMVIAEDGVFSLGKVVRIDLEGSQATRSGIRIGSTTADVLAAYGDQIVATPHKYHSGEGGEYLTYVPRDGADADYRLVMETENGIVTEIRSGLLPYVEYVDGCS